MEDHSNAAPHNSLQKTWSHIVAAVVSPIGMLGLVCVLLIGILVMQATHASDEDAYGGDNVVIEWDAPRDPSSNDIVTLQSSSGTLNCRADRMFSQTSSVYVPSGKGSFVGRVTLQGMDTNTCSVQNGDRILLSSPPVCEPPGRTLGKNTEPRMAPDGACSWA